MLNIITRAAVYTRVSTKRQVEKFGLAYQERDAKALISSNGWHFTKVYEDQGISGLLGPDKRQGLQYLLEDGTDNMFDKVVIFSVDRLGRSPDVVNGVYNELIKRNIGIVSCTEDLSNRNNVTQLALQANRELEIIRRRMISGKQERIKLDGECGGGLPYGYSRVDGKVTINKDNSNVVISIFEAYYTKWMSMRKIAEVLNTENIKGPKGGIWHHQTIHKILHNREKYSGCSRNGSQVDWPIILYNKYPDKRK